MMKKLMIVAAAFAFFAGTAMAYEAEKKDCPTKCETKCDKDGKKCDKEMAKKDCDKCPSKQ